MMRRTLLIAGLLFVAPLPANASMYSLFYDEMDKAISTTDPSEAISDYVIEEMEKWNDGRGIQITAADIKSAISDKLWSPDGSGLCQNKTDGSGNSYEFIMGGTEVSSCTALQDDILSLVRAEREVDQLGTDLLAITNGSELAVADEPHRPMNMAEIAMVVRRVWAGTGAAMIPWDGSADSDVNQLDGDLLGLSDRELEQVVYRFHYGYFRDQREADPRFNGIGDQIADDLQAIADTLGISGDPTVVGVFSVPKLQAKNVALWIRRDDIGLQWVYPTHPMRWEYKEAEEDYPELRPMSNLLAYPYAYEGSGISPGTGIDSPVCSRTMGRQGYLCRSQKIPPQNCDEPADNDKILLTRCGEEIFTTESGPRICPDFGQLYDDDGTPLEDPANPGQINPALTEADITKLCTPERKILYKDDVESHACYIGFCLAQSMSGHTLIPNRNTVVIGEATSPYLACQRTDPQLGLYTELVAESPYPMPEYQGHFLVQDFDRAFCGVFGNAPLPIAGLCNYNDNQQANLPHYTSVFNAQLSEREGDAVQYRQAVANSLSAAIGHRVVVDQSAEVQRKTFAKLANFINQIASLILELKNAPLTKTPCPWTGHFRSSSAP